MENEDHLLEIFLEPLRECMGYKPKFGRSDKEGLDLLGFQNIYGQDLFYSTLGLDIEPMYLAHKASGGITSIYRQLGVGCERVFRTILMNELKLTDEDVNYSYDKMRSDGSVQKLSLDARIPVNSVTSPAKERIIEWTIKLQEQLGFEIPINTIKGCTFEVRQGYKSADSKRQNADIANALKSYSDLYVPVVFVFSNQVSEQVVSRYLNNRIGVLRGVGGNDTSVCSYAFLREIIGFDFLEYMTKNKENLRSEIETIVSTLISS